MRREAIFVDGGYLDSILKDLVPNEKLNYADLFKRIPTNDYELLRIYYYHCMPFQSKPPTQGERDAYSRANSFFDKLSHINKVEVKFGRLQKINNRPKQKGVDVNLCVDLVRMSCAGHIQKAIIIGADSDFIPAIQAAKDAGVIIKMLYTKGTTHSNVTKVYDEKKELTKEFLERSLF